MNLKETYNRIAEDWTREHSQDDWWMPGVNKFISFLKPGSFVLDIGCASGHKAKYLISKGLKVTGIDFSEKMIEIIKREIPGYDFFVMDMKNLDDLKGNFDGIFAQNVLLHVSKKEVLKVLKTWLGKLRNSGYIYLSLKEKREDGPEEEVAKENDYGYDYERFFSYFTLDEIESYFKELNLKVYYKNSVDKKLQIIGQKQ